MSDELVKKICCTCKEEKVKVLYFTERSDKCRDCRKVANRKHRKSWGKNQGEYSQGTFFGGNWKPRKTS